MCVHCLRLSSHPCIYIYFFFLLLLRSLFSHALPRSRIYSLSTPFNKALLAWGWNPNACFARAHAYSLIRKAAKYNTEQLVVVSQQKIISKRREILWTMSYQMKKKTEDEIKWCFMTGSRKSFNLNPPSLPESLCHSGTTVKDSVKQCQRHTARSKLNKVITHH